MNITFKPTKKQFLALEYLNDSETEELLFGGGAGGGKSVLGCFWLVSSCLRYKESRWLLGRAKLKTLKESTVKTLFDVLKNIFKFTKDVHYTYNAIEGVVKFVNGSEIVFKDLFLYPSDPEFDSLGSSEYTGAFLDECSEITHKAKEIVMTRLRYKINEFDIIGKLLACTNPCKNWAYHQFYKLWSNKEKMTSRKFIQALVKDNPNIPKQYIENLKKRDKVTKERLLLGNWHYEDDPAKLMDYDKILDIFTNSYVKTEGGAKYLTIDPARFGQDKTVIMVWEGLYITKIFAYKTTDMKFIEEKITQLAEQEQISRSNIVVDEDGIGGGIKDHLTGIRGFVNNSTPINQGNEVTNYQNLKTQCYFKLAELINSGKIGANIENETYKELIIEDLEQVKRKDIDDDGKVKLVNKETVKENMGRSPDFSDCMMTRMFFELTGTFTVLDDIWDGEKDTSNMPSPVFGW